MLFDLSNPRRKNVVRVVYGLLAVVFGGGFIFFGIGSETGGGGLLDGVFGNGGTSTASQYEQQIEDAEEKVEADPTNERALADLARYRYLSGEAQLDRDETGQITGVSEEARNEFENAVEAWSRYLDADPKKIDIGAATTMPTAYRYLEDAGGAAEAQAIVAKENPSVNAYVDLAFYRYIDGDIKGGDKAAEIARKEAKPDQRKQADKILADYRKQALALKKQLAELPDSEEGGSQLENPFGSFGPEGGTAPPAAP